jgi:pyruvate/2-oxoglutarate dehydrogenase complex dihydrolipoamide dehydrogenase (E3) component
VSGSHLLLAIGRRPNTDDLGLDDAGIRHDERGYIVVDDKLLTNVPGIWALGDCNGKGQVYSYVAQRLRNRRLQSSRQQAAQPREPDRRACAVYRSTAWPRGTPEQEAQRRGRPILVGKRPMTRIARAIEKGETKGLMKIVVDAESEEILGRPCSASAGTR